MGGIIKEACCIAVAAVIAAAAMPACTSSRNGCWSVSIVDNGIAGTLQSQPASTTAYHHSHTTTPHCHAGEVCRGVCGGNDYIIEKKFFLRPMSDDSASDAAEAYASWVRHLRAASWPVLLAASSQVALLLFLRIPAEASALDNALKCEDATVPSLRGVSIVIAALPGALSFGVPIISSSMYQSVPMCLTRTPPSRHRPWLLGTLGLATIFSVIAAHTLHACLAAGGNGSPPLCTHSVFAWSRNPINVTTLLLAR